MHEEQADDQHCRGTLCMAYVDGILRVKGMVGMKRMCVG